MTKKAKEPTQTQLEALARYLKDHGGNVYQAMKGFNIDGGIGERIFDLLQEKANTFKCENCDDWMDLSHKAKGMGEDTLFCNPCVDEMDGKDPQHEDEE